MSYRLVVWGVTSVRAVGKWWFLVVSRLFRDLKMAMAAQGVLGSMVRRCCRAFWVPWIAWLLGSCQTQGKGNVNRHRHGRRLLKFWSGLVSGWDVVRDGMSFGMFVMRMARWMVTGIYRNRSQLRTTPADAAGKCAGAGCERT